MRKASIALFTIALLVATSGAAREQGDTGLNAEGFILNWVILAPIPLEPNQSGAAALQVEQVKDEAKLKPKGADKITTAKGKEMTWVDYKAKDFFFDFNDFLGAQTEDSVGYAVCYVHADKKLSGIKLRTGSDDQAKVYLNGKAVLVQDNPRSLEKDQDTTDVTLEQGQNVLVFKVVNEKIDWSGCARFTDKDGNPIKGLRVTTAPK
jgi:hypothetical protein